VKILLLKYYKHHSIILLVLFALIIMITIPYQIDSCTESRKNIVSYNNVDSCLVNSHQTQIDIRNLETINVREIFKITNTKILPISFIYLWLNHTCSNITIEDSSGLLDFEKIIESESFCYFKIYLRLEIQLDEITIFYISYILDGTSFTESTSYCYFEFFFNYYLLHTSSLFVNKASRGKLHSWRW